MTSRMLLASTYVEMGDAAAARPLLDEALPQARKFRHVRMEGIIRVLEAHVAFLDGDLETAQTLAEQGAAIAGECGYLYALGHGHRVLARIAERRGDGSAAAGRWQDARATFAQAGAAYEEDRAARALAEGARRLGA